MGHNRYRHGIHRQTVFRFGESSIEAHAPGHCRYVTKLDFLGDQKLTQIWLPGLPYNITIAAQPLNLSVEYFGISQIGFVGDPLRPCLGLARCLLPKSADFGMIARKAAQRLCYR